MRLDAIGTSSSGSSANGLEPILAAEPGQEPAGDHRRWPHGRDGSQLAVATTASRKEKDHEHTNYPGHVRRFLCA